MAPDRASRFVLAVHELVANAVRHGGGTGRLDLRRLDDTLTCEVIDHGGGAVTALPVRLPGPDKPGSRGLWLAQHLTDGLMLTRRPDGVTATVTACLTPTSVGPGVEEDQASTGTDDRATGGQR